MKILARNAVVLSMIVILGAPITSHARTTLDPDDTSGPLDVVAVRAKQFFHARTHPNREWAVLNLKLITYETWDNSHLAGIDSHITFEFDLDGDDRPDRCMEIRQGEDGNLDGQMYSAGCDFLPREPVGGLRHARHPDDHTLEIDFRNSLIGKRVKSFRWRAATSYDEEDDPQCPRPETLPPERRYATCTDFTRWTRHSV